MNLWTQLNHNCKQKTEHYTGPIKAVNAGQYFPHYLVLNYTFFKSDCEKEKYIQIWNRVGRYTYFRTKTYFSYTCYPQKS